MDIESFFPGRIRVRSKVFCNPARAEEALATIRKHDGICDATINTKTGSLTVLYNPAAIPMAALMQAKDELESLERQG